MRIAVRNDAKKIFNWRNDPWIVSLGTSLRNVSWMEHCRWFLNVINNPDCQLYIIENNEGIGIGTVRLVCNKENNAVITIYLMQEYTGKGIGVSVLRQICSMAVLNKKTEKFTAYVRKDNHPSISAFKKASFEITTSGPECPEDHLEMIFIPE